MLPGACLQTVLKRSFTVKSDIDGLNISEGIQVQKDHSVYDGRGGAFHEKNH